jgi:hypothetical protein
MAMTSPRRESREAAKERPQAAVRLDLEDGDVGQRVGAQHLRREFAPIGEPDGDLVRVLHDMGIGQHDAVLADDESRAFALHRKAQFRQPARSAAEIAAGTPSSSRHLPDPREPPAASRTVDTLCVPRMLTFTTLGENRARRWPPCPARPWLGCLQPVR